MATDRKAKTELEKLGELVSTLVEGMTQLLLDVAKMAARIGAIDDQVGAIGRRLDRDGSAREEQSNARDLALEQEVFGQFRTRAESDARGKPRRKARTRNAPAKNMRPRPTTAKKRR